jgi:DNA primase small subunit
VSAETRFLERQFRRYYTENASKIKPPRALPQREFGFTIPDKTGMIRHLGFKTPDELHEFLWNNAPMNSYYSSALYREPEAPDMPLKGWIGADLAFDIDADHIDTPCKAKHDSWLCTDCREKGTGIKPDRCPKCNSHKLEEQTWLCEECLGKAKSEAMRLIHEFLRDELGFTIEEMEIRFSGHRGYHVLIGNERAIRLEQGARREITDYMRGVGAVPEGASFRRPKVSWEGPELNEHGWQGRIARGIVELLKEHETDLGSVISLGKPDLKFLTSKRKEILSDLEKSPPIWDWLSELTKNGRSFLVEAAADREASEIDPLVTQDVHRLMRLPGSLHAKTGFIVKPLSVGELEKFDPWRDAVAFKAGDLSVHVRDLPATKIGDEQIGPLHEENLTVPFAVGVYLIAKKRAVFNER